MKKSGWNLYWVASDGLEDCFVVAKNRQSAERVERDMNGFDTDEVSAEKVGSIPISFLTSHPHYLAESKRWPWYASGKEIFDCVGAEYRRQGHKNEMLLNDVVYEYDDFVPMEIRRKRQIGISAIIEIAVEARASGCEPITFKDQILHHLIEVVVGTLILRCQRIEHLLSHSFIFAASEAEQRQGGTVSDFVERWKKKTFGQMLKAIRHCYTLNPLIDQALEMHRDMRNTLAHKLYSSDQFNLDTQWGTKETLTFLAFFDWLSQCSLMAAEAAFYFSIEYGNESLLATEKKIELSEIEREKAGDFLVFFSL